jgi:NAD(P)-dependent dehydrogenase (short-subunit alcohol dehydrogenase family)
MTSLENRNVLVIGGSSGIGRATVRALLARGARVVAVGRDPERLATLRREADVETRALDASDGAALDALVAGVRPDHVVLAAGSRSPAALVDEYSWESFSLPWNQDVKMSFELGRSVLRHGVASNGAVVFVSSGAGLFGSPLSGGYAGAKRTQMFLATYFQRAAKERSAAARFLAIVPKQLLPDTETGQDVSRAYAKLAGISQEKFMERFAVPLLTAGVADAIVKALQGDFAEASVVGVTGSGTEIL